MSDRLELEKQLFELLCYLSVSARNCVDETKLYGPLRLIEAVSRIIDIMAGAGMGSESLGAIRERIEGAKYLVMTDVPAFVKMLDDVAEALAADLALRD
ncbi:MAG TPA: hypothetical protein GX513_11095 [Firmicutes bacterium]|nr:hypothetical protein [Bacillota bacterium]